MQIAITDRNQPFKDCLELTSDEFVQRNAEDQQSMGALQRLIATGERQYLGEHFILHLPPQKSDPLHYTCYDLTPVSGKPEEEEKKRSVTSFEIQALDAIDYAETISDPLSKSNVARMALRLGCTIARALR